MSTEVTKKLINELKICVDEIFETTHSVSTSFYSYIEKNQDRPEVIKKDCIKVFDTYPLTPSLLENKRVRMGTVELSCIYSSLGNSERQLSLMQVFLSVIEKDRNTKIVKKEFGIIIEPLPMPDTVFNKKQPVVESLESSSSSDETSSDEEGPDLKELLSHIFVSLQNVNKSKEEYINSLPVPDGVYIKK